mmetsp:Transcript_35493/g.101347  ORF Transcript_35493/g.101347 Transcript_35493/m.101347 type:complete len:765 (+) Transcript_35493:57-2351(+)
MLCNGAEVELDGEPLKVTIVSASGLRAADWATRKSDPYCICEIAGKPETKNVTQVVNNTLAPVWNHTISYDVFEPGDQLVLTVWDSDYGKSHDLLGRITLPTVQFYPDGFNGELQLEDAGKGVRALLKIEVSRSRPRPEKEKETETRGWFSSQSRPEQKSSPSTSNPGAAMGQSGSPSSREHDGEKVLKVTILSASGIRVGDFMGKSDPYCTCEILGKPEGRFQTQVMKNTLYPHWGHEGSISGYEFGDSLAFAVWDEDWGKRDFLGEASLPHSEFYPIGFEGEVALKKAGDATQSDGTLRIKVEAPVGSVTGLGIRRRLWAKFGSEDPTSITGFGVRRRLIKNPYHKIEMAVVRKTREAKLSLIDMSTPYRKKLMLVTRESLKAALVADPAMWVCVSNWVKNVVDDLWQDVVEEVEVAIEEMKLGVAGHTMLDVDSLRETGQRPCCCSYKWFRAFILYRFLPFDKSIFGCMADPVYWLLTIVSCVPNVRVAFYLVLLLLFLQPGPLDEFQLVQYIMLFKGIQFLTSGLGMVLVGAGQYYLCIRADGTHDCMTSGPGSSRDAYLAMTDLLGSCLLCWTAFLLLPCSEKTAGLRYASEESLEEAEAKAEEEDNDNTRRYCCCCAMRVHKGRGGRLQALLRYDLRCFILSMGLLLVMEVHSCIRRNVGWPTDEKEFWDETHTWHFKTRLFWVRAVYSLLALPFFLFNIPVLQSVLTHTRATGWNPNGVVVAYLLPPVVPEPSTGPEIEETGGVEMEQRLLKAEREV